MEIDLLDGDFYVNDPYTTYAWMRENAPAYWDATNELWGVSRYDDIVAIEKRKDLFINSDQNKGGYRPNIPADPAIIGLDDPLHQQRRNLVARRFTPKAVSTGRTTSAPWSAVCSTTPWPTARRSRSWARSLRRCRRR